MVDYFSNFFELMRLSSSTRTKCVIDAMRSQFARHGVPEVVMSDNGPQFSCGVFREFAQRWDFEHVTSSPRYAQSSGHVERAIGTVKNLVKKAMEDGSDVQLALLNFRNTVREGYSASPAQLLFGRRCRTLLPIQRSRLIPKLATDVYRDKKIAKNPQIEQYKSARHLNPLAPGDAIRMKLPGQDTWMLGECTKKVSNRPYVILIQGHTYIRNRRHLRLEYENLPLPDSEPWEMRANPLPLEAGLMSRTTPRAETIMPMSELPPSEEPMPIQDTSPPRVDSIPMRRGTHTRKPPVYLT